VDGSSKALDFYDELKGELAKRPDKVDIYTISSCFGFYSRGMKAFSEVLQAMREALHRPEPFQTSQMRLLLAADENPIDNFGVQRFHSYLAPRLLIRRMDKPARRDEWLQFAVFDDERVLVTRPQDGSHDEALDLGVNHLAAAEMFSFNESPEIVKRHAATFNRTWDQSSEFSFPTVPTLRELTDLLERNFPPTWLPNGTEKDYQDQLHIFLHPICAKQAIHREFRYGESTVDFALGDPKVRLLAVELKLATNDEDVLKKLSGQIHTYRAFAHDVLAVLVGSDITREKLARLQKTYQADSHVRIIRVG
jgi:hypothetical protein